LILRGSFTQADERHYSHVPFLVPDGVRAITIAYDYSDRIPSDPLVLGGNTLDIGLFDSRGAYRGWSGSHKLQFTVSDTWATPAYVAGPVHAGTWRLLLGPYKVGPHGCEYEVSITFSDDPGEPPPGGPTRINVPPASLDPPAEEGWLRGDLHCHTVYSDGDSWPADMLAEAVTRGLDFLGVTDHNQTGHQADYLSITGQALPLILPGIEVTTYGGHWNAWGTDRWWDFLTPTTEAVDSAMHAAIASGAVVSVNHPKPHGPGWEYSNATGFHTVEVWNGHWHEHNDVSLHWWDTLLRQGRRVFAVGGSDTHHLKGTPHDRLGHPTTWAQADRALPSVLAALREGRTFISRDVDGPQLYLSRERLRVVGASGATLLVLSANGIESTRTIRSDDETLRVHTGARYLRAELRDPRNEMLALTNAVFTS